VPPRYEPEWRYVIALGSNMRHRRFGDPRRVLQSALGILAWSGCRIEAVSPTITSRPLGPSRRAYANAAAVIACPLTPHALLGLLQGVEGLHGRRRRGARWGARTLDLDIVLWSGGRVHDPRPAPVLAIPHPHYRERRFVLGPAAAIAPRWRDCVTGLTLAQSQARLTRPRPLPR
jgi:2-amino-4-hydroxy-6-hydroxymethyldihydropteridine diphosphokinase